MSLGRNNKSIWLLRKLGACLTTKIVKLLNRNRELLEVKKKDKVEVDALKKEAEQV